MTRPESRGTEKLEAYLSNQARALTRKQYKKILEQQERSLCQITTTKCNATGFLCKIPEKVLITCNHVLGEKEIKPGEKIKIYFTDEKEKKQFKTINIDDKRKIYTIGKLNNELIDVTIIEIKPEDNLDDERFLEIDEYLKGDDAINEYTSSKDIYIIQYKGGKDIATSDGIIKEIKKEKYSYIIHHTCDTDEGSSGSPIILYNHKVIGVHRGWVPKKEYNNGFLLQYPIKEYHKILNGKNLITIDDKSKIIKPSDDNPNKNAINKIKMTYQINKENKNMKILGKEFIKNNEKNCKLEINKKEEKLCEFIDFDKYGINKNTDLTVFLKGINTITNAKDMFSECKSLKSLPDISEWDTKNVTNMNNIFSDCISLKSLPDISKWNTKNVTNMGNMFYNCSSLKSLPDISKWDTKIVTDMNNIFRGCKSLVSLPDISKWVIKNVTKINHMFNECELLKSLPDISKWDTKNVTHMNNIFRGCNSLQSLPDISKWETKNVTDMSFMFDGCKSLVSLPDISKWNTKNVKDMNHMFCWCSSLKSLPDISKWDTENVKNKANMFDRCRRDLNFPSNLDVSIMY